MNKDLIFNILPWLLVFSIPLLSYIKRAFTLGAAISSVILLSIISIADKRSLYLIIFSFSTIAVIEKAVKASQKCSDDPVNKKSGPRDLIQLCANGGAALIFSIIYLCIDSKFCLIGFSAAISEALGDSMASAIGSAVSGKVIDICRRKEIQKGLSGGISFWGSFSCIIACAMVSLFAILVGTINFQDAICVMIASTISCFLDSVLGSCMQIKYRCRKCGIVTEKEEHCAESTEYYSGVVWIDNDVVNAVCNVMAGVIAIALSLLSFQFLISVVIVIIAASLTAFLSSALHECGHAVGVILTGGKVALMRIYPFEYIEGKWRLSFSLKGKNCCAFLSSAAKKAIFAYLLGPVANLLTIVLFLVVLLSCHYQTICAIGITINAYKFFSNIIPHGDNDGYAILEIIKERKIR